MFVSVETVPALRNFVRPRTGMGEGPSGNRLDGVRLLVLIQRGVWDRELFVLSFLNDSELSLVLNAFSGGDSLAARGAFTTLWQSGPYRRIGGKRLAEIFYAFGGFDSQAFRGPPPPSELAKAMLGRTISKDEAAVLTRVRGEAAEEENRDLAVIDAFFGDPEIRRFIQDTRGLVSAISRSSAGRWGIDLESPWGKAKVHLGNVLLAERAIRNYPWPSPPAYINRFYFETVGDKFRKFLKNGKVTEENIRTFITLSLLENFDAVIDRVNSFLKKKEKKAKRRAIIKAVAGILIGIVIAVLAPTIIAVVYSTAQTAGELVEKKKAARSLVKTAKQFYETDREFAMEIERVAKILDAEAAEAEKQAALSDEEKLALMEGDSVWAVLVEGVEVGRADNVDQATVLAMEKTKPGDRFELAFEGRVQGLFIRSAEGAHPVPADRADTVRAMNPEELKQTVLKATEEVKKRVVVSKEREAKEMPWWVLIPLAAAVL